MAGNRHNRCGAVRQLHLHRRRGRAEDTDQTAGEKRGGAGTGAYSGKNSWDQDNYASVAVDSEYPMRGSAGNYSTGHDENTRRNCCGGTGNPNGNNVTQHGDSWVYSSPYSGCGGRIIIFCINFINNGIITVNGTQSNGINGDSVRGWAPGGASGAGAIDLFYTSLNERGALTADGGNGLTISLTNWGSVSSGAGGNGSITLTQWSLDKIVKEERKKFTRDNWIYLMNNYSQRLKDEVI